MHPDGTSKYSANSSNIIIFMPNFRRNIVYDWVIKIQIIGVRLLQNSVFMGLIFCVIHARIFWYTDFTLEIIALRAQHPYALEVVLLAHTHSHWFKIQRIKIHIIFNCRFWSGFGAATIAGRHAQARRSIWRKVQSCTHVHVIYSYPLSKWC